jgi:hypothetical protein
MKKVKLIIALVITAALAGCYNHKADVLYPNPGGCDTKNVSFSADILPVLLDNCANGCHDHATQQYGLDVTNYEGFIARPLDRTLAALKHENGYSPMPKGLPKLDDCSIKKIEAWMNAGAPNN